MTKEELEKATGQELIEQRNYCGVDGYYGDYILDVNAEMLKRFNRLVELEKENAELKAKLKPENCLKLLAKGGYVKFTNDKLSKAKEIIERLVEGIRIISDPKIYMTDVDTFVSEAEQFLEEN